MSVVNSILALFLGDKSKRDMKEVQPYLERIKAAYPEISKLSNDGLRQHTQELKQRIAAGYAEQQARIDALKQSIEHENPEVDEREKMYEEIDRLEKEITDLIEKTLDEILPEAFSIVKETARRFKENSSVEVTASEFDRDLAARADFVEIDGDKARFANSWLAGGTEITWDMVHYDVQLIGGVVLHQGKIAEMATGEGKTLVATLPVYLNALAGRGVHVVTVNDYLARRDSEWMGKLYQFLGMSVGVVLSGQSTEEKRAAYQADITYGTNNEFGFDYLRDNMAFSIEDKVQRPLHYAIVDEVDSILIDEARTPLIISGAAEDSSEMYRQINTLIPSLEKGEVSEEDGEPSGDFTIDENTRQVDLTESGHEKVEQLLLNRGLLKEGENLYSAANLALLHHVHSGLRAHHLFHREVDYLVQNGQVVIVDEHTGRTMPGRRWSEGLHQAIEAKEGVEIKAESQTLASTTFQNYFRMYDKLAGMTGTADTEAFEFRQIYGLDVVVIPPNKPVQRIDYNDLIYLTQEEKFHAIIDEIKHVAAENRPVLVGTASVEASELLSSLLKKARVEHKILNAKHHESEAQVIAQAGRPGAVTIATNMAGRGTDIMLGGNWETEVAALENPTQEQVDATKADWEERHQQVLSSGGLHIIGTERHESRRIDNQLRGRAGRQGDPGSSRFFLSMEDNLMRIFASDRVKALMQRLGMQQGEAIESGLVTKAI